MELLESDRKMLGVGVSRNVGDLLDALAGCQQRYRLLQAELIYPLLGRFAHHALEKALKLAQPNTTAPGHHAEFVTGRLRPRRPVSDLIEPAIHEE